MGFSQIKTKFIQACQEGNCQQVKELLSHLSIFMVGENLLAHSINLGISEACQQGHLEVLKTLLFSEPIKPYLWQIDLRSALEVACANGQLQVVKYLTCEQELAQHNIPLLDLSQYNSALSHACQHGHQAVVQYLLHGSELKTHCDIASQEHLPLRLACENNHLHLMQYLLDFTMLGNQRYWQTLPEKVMIQCINSCCVGNDGASFRHMMDILKARKDILYQANMLENPFLTACNHYELGMLSALELVKIFIFEENIELTPYIQENLYCPEIQQLFHTRGFCQKLQNHLPAQAGLAKKAKI